MLKYIRVYDYSRYNESMIIKLAYMLDNFYGMIDAKSGKFIDYSGKPITETNKVPFTDIADHKFEKDIKLLVELGIIDSTDSKFNPESRILQKDFVKFLMKATQPDYYPIPYATSDSSEYDRYYEIAIAQNILAKQDKNPEACVTTMAASKMMIRALGVGFLADLGNMFVSNLKDAHTIPTKDIGYVAIADTLNLVDTADGNFKPNLELTKADTAGMLINYLKVEKTPSDSQPVEAAPNSSQAYDLPAIMPITK
jgi:hypothetical protein